MVERFFYFQLPVHLALRMFKKTFRTPPPYFTIKKVINIVGKSGKKWLKVEKNDLFLLFEIN